MTQVTAGGIPLDMSHNGTVGCHVTMTLAKSQASKILRQHGMGMKSLQQKSGWYLTSTQQKRLQLGKKSTDRVAHDVRCSVRIITCLWQAATR